MDPTELYLDARRRVIMPDGTLEPSFWKFLQDLQVSLTTVDLTTQVTGILPLVNGGTSSAVGPQASTITGATLAANVLASSLTSVGILNGLSVAGLITSFTDLYSVPTTDYTATSTIVGWSSFTSGRKFIIYKQYGKTTWCRWHLEGTSNSTAVTFTLPQTSAGSGSYPPFTAITYSFDNGTVTTAGMTAIAPNASTVTCYPTTAQGSWTNSGTKIVNGQIWFENT